jgi:hypothetical protein
MEFVYLTDIRHLFGGHAIRVMVDVEAGTDVYEAALFL